MKISLQSALILYLIGSTAVVAFTANKAANQQPKQSFSIEVALRNVAGTFIAASTILSNVLIMVPEASYATNMELPMESSTQLLAGRSGGRAGGRAAPSRSVSRPSSPTVIQRRTTVIQAPPVVVSPGYGGYGGYGAGFYSPQPSGLGLAIGLNAISGIGEGFREARQENEIRSTRDQLNDARVREAEMAAKIEQLEKMQQLQMTK